MSARTRRSLTLTWTALFVLSLLLQYFSFAAAPPALAAHEDPPGLFELEGNAIDEPALGADWQNGPEGAADSFFVGAEAEAAANDVTFFTTGGSKDENDIPSWAITDNGTPDKDDILDAFAAVYQAGGDTWVYFGADRFDNDGTAQIGFWFFQDDVGIANGDFTGNHVDGDVLIISEYTNGGVVRTICAYQWDGGGGGTNIPGPGLCDRGTAGSNLNLVAAGTGCDVADGIFDICAKTNDDVETAPWEFLNKDDETDFGIGQFFEGGFNLSDMFDPGVTPCFGSFLAETRTSAETDAQLKDFALGDFNTCVPPTIATQVSQSTVDFGQSVTDTATFSGPNGPVTGTATFFLCGPTPTAAGCATGGTQIGSAVTIVGGLATSAAFSPPDAMGVSGAYCFRVEYAPDAASQYLAGSHTNATTECFTVPAPGIEVLKSAGQATVSAGTAISFDITVNSIDVGTALNVSMTDTLPTNAGLAWTIAPGFPTGDPGVSCAIAAGVLTCTDGSMPNGDSFTVRIQSVTTAATCGTVNNTANVTTSNDGLDSASASIIVNCPDIQVTKLPDGGTVNAGGTITWTIEVRNIGLGTATAVTLTDNLPAGIDWSEGEADCTIAGAVGSEVLSCTVGDLAPGTFKTYTVTGPADTTDCGLINNTATATATNEPGTVLVNNTDSGSVTVTCAVIDIVKNAVPVGPVIAGAEIGFDIIVTNTGNGAATNVHVSDDLPAGITWIADAPTGNTTGVTCGIVSGDLVCNDAEMLPLESFTVHVHGVTDTADCGVINNTALVTTGNDGTDNDPASVTVLCPDVAVLKTADDPVISAGENAAFTITVTSVGADPAQSVVLDDTLPAGVTWTVINVTRNGIAIANPCDPIAGGVLHCALGDMAPGDTVVIHIAGQTDFTDCGTLHNVVTVGAAAEIPGGGANNTDDADILVNCPALGIAKSSDHDVAVVAGNQIGFTITVVNNGAGDALNTHVTDTLPAGFSWSIQSQSQTPPSPAINDFTLVGNVLSFDGTLPAGAQISVHVVSPTDFQDCGLVPNTAFLTQGETAVNDSASESVRCPDIGIDKTSNDADGIVDIGQTVTFTILAEVAQGPVTNAVITDELPDGQTYVTGTQASNPVATTFTVSPDGQTLTWTYASLANGDPAVTITYNVTIDADAEGELTNVAELCVSEVPTCESADETVEPNPELGIEKSNDAPIETLDLGDGTTIDLPTAEEGATVTYTLAYTVEASVTNAVIEDVLPAGVTYVDGTASSDAQFTFVDFDGATRTLTWTAALVSVNGTLTYDVTIDVGAAELQQPLVNVATIDSEETEPASDDSPVFVPPVPLELTPPPTDALAPSAPSSSPGFALMLVLLAIAGLALTIGFITPVPESVRRRDRLG